MNWIFNSHIVIIITLAIYILAIIVVIRDGGTVSLLLSCTEKIFF